MTVTSTRISSRSKAVPPPQAPAEKPLYAETKSLFDAVSQHRLDLWLSLADDELDLVDMTPDGRHVILRNWAEVEAWLQDRAHNCKQQGIQCETDLLEYDVVVGTDLAFCTAYFKQSIRCRRDRVVHFGAATVIWRRDGNRWRASRWHCTLERSDRETLPRFG